MARSQESRDMTSQDNPTLPTFNEIAAEIVALETRRLDRLEGRKISSTSKLPFKALSIQQTLTWRMVELCRGALDSFQSNRMACASLLTRASIETCAALWYLGKKLQA